MNILTKNFKKKTELYKIKEIYPTIQCEGYHSGRVAIFCRFTGCNLWSGREIDREKAICSFCDTDFWGTDGINGGKYSATELAKLIDSFWISENTSSKFVVFTGGEPLLQLDDKLIQEMHKMGFQIAIETNGTIEVPGKIDWVSFSPKANSEIIITSANEIKIVYPQEDLSPSDFDNFDTNHFYLQPMDNESQKENTKNSIQFCMKHPKWKLSVQTHKFLGIL